MTERELGAKQERAAIIAMIHDHLQGTTTLENLIYQIKAREKPLKKKKSRLVSVLPLTQNPTFEMKYGPWICMGCGHAHPSNEDCPKPYRVGAL